MKKIYCILAICLASCLALTSCEKENQSSGGSGDGSVVGTWQFRGDEYHYFDATFKKDGNYEWMWIGASGRIKDTGSYTVSGNVITMTPKKLYEEDYDTKELVETSLSSFQWNGPRKVTVVRTGDGIAYWRWSGDFLIENSDFFRGNEGEPYLVFKQGANFKFKSSDLVGTWECQYETGVVDRYIFTSKGYTYYSAWPEADAGCGLSVRKETGEWSLDKNALTIKEKMDYTSSKFIKYNRETGKNEYEYVDVDPVTFETDNWFSYESEYEHTIYIYVEDGKLYMPEMTLTKKK
jgi:hypothetical protein